ncbi:MAG: rod shape-determining protein MreD [Treponema sp.]
MKHVILWTCCTACFISIFQTAVLSHLKWIPVFPDFLLLLIIYVACHNGAVTGVIIGFLSGLLLDFLSIAPFGLHAFVFTVMGFVYGKLYGKYNTKAFFFSLIFGVTGVILKALLLFLLRFLFGTVVQVYDLFSVLFLVELVLTTVFAPALFFVLQFFPSAFENRGV